MMSGVMLLTAEKACVTSLSLLLSCQHQLLLTKLLCLTPAALYQLLHCIISLLIDPLTLLQLCMMII